MQQNVHGQLSMPYAKLYAVISVVSHIQIFLLHVRQVWSLKEKPNGHLLYDVPLHGSEYITCVQFSPDKISVLSADGNGCVKVRHTGMNNKKKRVVS